LKEKQDTVIQKYLNLKESNAVIQIIWKVKIENIEWFLLEKKELQLQKSLEIKNKSSSGSSIIERKDWNLFWLKANSISEDLFDKFMTNSKSIESIDEITLKFEDFYPADQVSQISSNELCKHQLQGVYDDLQLQRKQFIKQL